MVLKKPDVLHSSPRDNHWSFTLLKTNNDAVLKVLRMTEKAESILLSKAA